MEISDYIYFLNICQITYIWLIKSEHLNDKILLSKSSLHLKVIFVIAGTNTTGTTTINRPWRNGPQPTLAGHN